MVYMRQLYYLSTEQPLQCFTIVVNYNSGKLQSTIYHFLFYLLYVVCYIL